MTVLVRQDNIGIQVAVLINCPDCLHVLADYNVLCRIAQRQVILTGGDVIPVAALCGGDVPAVLRVCAAHGERVALDGAHECKCHLLLRVNRRGKRIGDLTARHRDGDGIRRLDVLKSVFAHVAADTGSSAEAVISIAGIIARTMLKASSHARILLC